MRASFSQLTIVASSAATVLFGALPAMAMTPAGEQAMTRGGQVMFEHRCRSCHADDPSLKAYGPSLLGIVGRKAASIEGFAYSDAMKSSGIVWTEDKLRAWIADNTTLLPGTRMRHVEVTDRMEQDMLLSFLKSLK
jgi:cytochrome c